MRGTVGQIWVDIESRLISRYTDREVYQCSSSKYCVYISKDKDRLKVILGELFHASSTRRDNEGFQLINRFPEQLF